MLSLRHGHDVACGLIFLLSLLGAQSIEADEIAFRSPAISEPSTGVAADSTLMPAPIADATVKTALTPTPATKSTVVALVDPAPTALLPKLAMPPARPPAAAPAWPAPARFFTINEVLANHRQATATSSSVQLAAVDPAGPASDVPSTTTPPIRGNEPFGLFTFRAPEGLLWKKWRKVEADIQAEAPALSRCRAEPDHCTRAESRFVTIVKDAETRHGRGRLKLVNRRINAAIRYRSDIAQWGTPDLWSAPLDANNKGSFDTGLGDCEDYAIAKYVALRRAGIAAADLRLLLVRDRSVGLDHAVLAARQDGHWLILDNRWNRLIQDTELKQFIPLFALNDGGVKLFAAPYAAKHPAIIDDLAKKQNDKLIAAATNRPISDRSSDSIESANGSLPLLM